jgi:carbon monoxide dehydrogenase subunit G
VLERTPDSVLRLLAHAKGIGSGNDVEAVLTLAPQDGSTRLHWSAEAKNFTGLLKMVPAGLMQGAAQKVIADVWETVKRKLANA